MHFSKTRIAPTPSGFLHLGNVYSFAITAAAAQKYGASLLLRIDDMDRDRVHPEYLADVFETLAFLGISYDEGPSNPADFEAHYSQRHRLSFYEVLLGQLVATGKVYACSCSRKQIETDFGGVYHGACQHKKIALDTPGVAWRIDTRQARPILVRALDGSTTIAALPEGMHHFVVRKKDGFPAYQLTSLADDLYFGVDLIVRGQDLWPSTLAQLFLADLLGADAFLSATFHHHELLTDGHDRKLSKSAGDTSVLHFRNQGLTAAGLYSRIGGTIGKPIEKPEDFSALIPD